MFFQYIVKPLHTKIVSANDLLIAGKSVPLRCETWGSYPPAKVNWLLDGEPLRNSDITAHTDVNSNTVIFINTLTMFYKFLNTYTYNKLKFNL